MLSRALLLLQCGAVCATSHPLPHTSGPCAGKDLAGPAEDMLRGAHLNVYEQELPPYSFRDPTSLHGWGGFDIELFSAVADKLGFTFNVSEPTRLPDEDYTDMLLRTVRDTDLWLSWWLRSRDRMNGAAMLAGHIDASLVLVAPPPTTGTSGGDSVWDNFDGFFKPFSYQLWGCIALLIIIAGMVDFLLEFGYGGSLPSSLYEAFGGVLWGGFQVSAPASSSPRLNGGRLDLIA